MTRLLSGVRSFHEASKLTSPSLVSRHRLHGAGATASSSSSSALGFDCAACDSVGALISVAWLRPASGPGGVKKAGARSRLEWPCCKGTGVGGGDFSIWFFCLTLRREECDSTHELEKRRSAWASQKLRAESRDVEWTDKIGGSPGANGQTRMSQGCARTLEDARA